MDVEPGRSLVNGSPHRQGQTPRAGRGGGPSDATNPSSHPYDRRRSGTCRRGSGTALDRTGSGSGGDGLDLDAGPQRQGGHPEQSTAVHMTPCSKTTKYLKHKII